MASEDVVAAADAHRASQASLRLATVAAVVAAWQQIDPARAVEQWVTGLGQRIFTLLSMAQETVAAEATLFVQDTLELQGPSVSTLQGK